LTSLSPENVLFSKGTMRYSTSVVRRRRGRRPYGNQVSEHLIQEDFIPKTITCTAIWESFASSTVLKQGFNGDGAVVSYQENTKEIIMKLTTTIVLASAFALSGTTAIAHTVRHESHVRTYPIYRDAAPSVVLHPNYGKSERQSRRSDHIERNRQFPVRGFVGRYQRLQLRERPVAMTPS
jgi:hypothetical protein